MSLSNAPSAQPTERAMTTSTTAPLTTPSQHTSSKSSLSSSTSASKTTTSSSSPSSSSSTPRPTSAVSIAAAEYRNAHKWDACVENALVKTGYGLLAAGALSLLLFRSAGARSAVIGLGGGFGAGMSWVECKQTFAAQSFAHPQMSTLQLPSLPQTGATSSSLSSSTHNNSGPAITIKTEKTS